MCRLAVYDGPPVPLSTLLYDAPTSLSRLAYAPQELLSGTVNVDGTGIAWWDPQAPDAPPLRYATTSTPWADANLPALAPRLSSGMQVAAVRGATPGVPFSSANVAPFVHGGLAFAHNGWLGGFRATTGRRIAAALPADLYGAIDAVSDSLLVFLTCVAELEAGADGLEDAVQRGLRSIAGHLRAEGEAGTLNVVLSDGRRTVLTRTSVDRDTNSLYLIRNGERWPGATVVASEPLDDDAGWERIDPGTVLVLDKGTVDSVSLHL